MGTLARTNPVGVNVFNMIAPGTFGVSGAIHVSSPKTVRVPYSTAGGTANAGYIAWINPEPTTILVTDVISVYTTGGTGTIDMGVSDDGTGSNDDIFNAGTMSNVLYGNAAKRDHGTGTAGIGTLQQSQDTWVLGPGATGTNNSIVGKTAETATTAVGYALITYIAQNS